MTSIIKVDNIQSSGGTGAITIDSSGNVSITNKLLIPSVPAFRIGRGTAQSVTSTGITLIEFNESSGDNHFMQGGITLSGGVVTVPVAGVYQFCANVRLSSIGAGYAELRLYKNNTAASNNFGYVINGSPDGSNESLTLTTMYQLDANDNVRLNVNTNSDGAYTISANSELTGHLVG